MSKVSLDVENRISAPFQKRLLEIMDEEEMTKQTFAAYLGVSRDVVIRATLYGIIPSVLTLIKMADKLNISLDYLLGLTDDATFDKSSEQATFQDRLELLVKERGVKYSQIAHSMPFPENYFYDWRRQKLLPSLEYLRALAGYFEVSMDYLIGRTDYRK